MDENLIHLLLTHQLFEDIDIRDYTFATEDPDDEIVDYESLIVHMYNIIGLGINRDNYPTSMDLVRHLKVLFLLNTEPVDKLKDYKLKLEETPDDCLFMYDLSKMIEVEQYIYTHDEDVMGDAMLVFINHTIESEIEPKLMEFIHEIFDDDGLLYLISLEDKAPLTNTTLYIKDKQMINALYTLDTTELDEPQIKKFYKYITVISAKQA